MYKSIPIGHAGRDMATALQRHAMQNIENVYDRHLQDMSEIYIKLRIYDLTVSIKQLCVMNVWHISHFNMLTFSARIIGKSTSILSRTDLR